MSSAYVDSLEFSKRFSSCWSIALIRALIPFLAISLDLNSLTSLSPACELALKLVTISTQHLLGTISGVTTMQEA